MVLTMEFKLKHELELPVNYQHMLQSALYALVRNESREEKNYHDEGALYEKRAFGLFVFGRIQGKCSIEVPDEELPELSMIEVCEKDKVVTKYKGFYITAWKGQYRLTGKQEYLDFLYRIGLGCRNSQGFGLFQIVV